MKKNIYAFIIFFMFLNHSLLDTAFATGVQISPQAEKNFQPQIQVQKMPTVSPKTDKIPPIINSQTKQTELNKSEMDSFKPVVEPIQKLDSSLKVGTSIVMPCCDKISLPEAIDYALSHNLDIKGNRLNVDIARNNIKVANRLRNPYVLSFFNFGRASIDNPNTMGLIFPIDIAKRGPRKNLAKSNLELTKGNVTLAELTLRLDVRQAYVDLVAAKSILKILNEQRQLLQELLDIAQKKYAAGAVPQMDVIHAKMTLNQLLIQVNSANTDVYIARYKFNMLLDPAKKNADTIEDYLPEQNKFISILTPQPTAKMPSFDDIYNIAMDNRIDIKNAQKDIAVAQKNLTLVIRQRIPDIELGGGYMFVPQQNATDGTFSPGAFVAGNITNIPLLYQYSPEIKNAKLQVEQKDLAYRSLKHQAGLDVHSAYDGFITAQDNLNYYNDILLTESKQFLSMAKRSYMVGKSSLTDLIFIEQSYKAIMMGYTNALANYYDSWVEILRQVQDERLGEELKANG